MAIRWDYYDHDYNNNNNNNNNNSNNSNNNNGNSNNMSKMGKKLTDKKIVFHGILFLEAWFFIWHISMKPFLVQQEERCLYLSGNLKLPQFP